MRILCIVCAKFHLGIRRRFFKKNFAEFNTVAAEGDESLEAPNIFECVLLFLLYYHAMRFYFYSPNSPYPLRQFSPTG